MGFDHWPTPMNIRVLRTVCLTNGLLWRVSSSAELRSFCSACALTLRNLPRALAPKVSSKMVLIMNDQTSEGEKNVALSFFSELADIFRKISCFSAGASFLLQGVFLCPILKFWRTKPALLRFTLLNNSLRWTLSFLIFYVVCLSRFWRCDLIPKIVCSSVKSTSTSAALHPGIRNQNVLTPSRRLLVLFHHFSSALYWADCQLQYLWVHTCRRICVPIQICNFDIREDVNEHTTDSYNSLTVISCTLFDLSFRIDCSTQLCFLILCLRSWSRRGRLCWLSTLIFSVAETWVSSWTLSFCSPLVAFSHFPFNADIFPFWLLTSIPVSIRAVWSFDRCVFLPESSIFDSWASLDFDQFLGALPIRSEAEQIHVFSSCTDSPRHLPWVFHLKLMELGPILYQNLECHLLVKRQWIDLKDQEQLHERQQLWSVRRSCKPSVFLRQVGSVFGLFASTWFLLLKDW